MTSRRVFGWFYRLGFTPWDGQPVPPDLCALIEGSPDAAPLTPWTALDVGCGTGQIAVYLAQHRWRVTGVDFVIQPLRTARARAAAAGVNVNFLRADVTRLSADGVGGEFGLIVDAGCLHNISARSRGDYAREITAAAAPGALLFVVGFPPNTQRGVPGITDDELQQLLLPCWKLQSHGERSTQRGPLRTYLLEKTSPTDEP